jgi:hypothetical protein
MSKNPLICERTMCENGLIRTKQKTHFNTMHTMKAQL